MKYLFLIILSFNVFAKDLRLEITRDDGFKGIIEVSEAEYADRVKKLIKHPMYKGEWKKEQSGYIVSKEIEVGWTNEGGEIAPILETRYFIPSNFSINVVDITAEKQAEIDARLARIQDIAEVKAIDIDGLPINPQLKKILKRLVQEIGE